MLRSKKRRPCPYCPQTFPPTNDMDPRLGLRNHIKRAHPGLPWSDQVLREQDATALTAQARLHRAARELLAALRLCRDALNEEVTAAGDVSHPTIRRHAKVAERADAAIAKAEGR